VPGPGNDNVRVHHVRTHMQTFAPTPSGHKPGGHKPGGHKPVWREPGGREPGEHKRHPVPPSREGRDQLGPGHGGGLGQAAVDHDVGAEGADLDVG
jgi:hypothetical protein